MLIGGNTCAATCSSPVISNPGNDNNNPANGNPAPWVITTDASASSPNRAAVRSAVRATGAANTTSWARGVSSAFSCSTRVSAPEPSPSATLATTPTSLAEAGSAGAFDVAVRPSATRTVAVDTPVAAAIFSSVYPAASRATIRAANPGVSLIGPFGPVRARTSPATPLQV